MGKRPVKSKKQERKEEKGDFLPGAETEEQFEKVLSLLSEWIKAGIVSVKVDTDGNVAFRLPSELDELLQAQVPDGLTHENLVSIIKSEMAALISANCARNPREQLKDRIPKELNEKIDIMLERMKIVGDKLIDENLKQRILLRQTTPGYIIEEIRGIGSTYHVEAPENEETNVPYIALEISLARPRSRHMLVVSPEQRTISFSRKDDVKVTVELHKDDLKDLIEELNRIQQKMYG